MLLTLELLPLLLDTAAESGDGRIIFVSSYGHFFADPFDANRLNRTEDDYSRIKEYSNTKLYNVNSFLRSWVKSILNVMRFLHIHIGHDIYCTAAKA